MYYIFKIYIPSVLCLYRTLTSTDPYQYDLEKCT